jgi:hypothetical protein
VKLELEEAQQTVSALQDALARQKEGIPRVVASLIEALRNHLRAGVSFEDASAIVLAMYGIPVEASIPDAPAYCPPPLEEQQGTRHEGLRGPVTEPDSGDTRVSPSFGEPNELVSFDRANRHHRDLAYK